MYFGCPGIEDIAFDADEAEYQPRSFPTPMFRASSATHSHYFRRRIISFDSPGFEGSLYSLLGFGVLSLYSQVVEFPGVVLKVVELELGRIEVGVEGCADTRTGLNLVKKAMKRLQLPFRAYDRDTQCGTDGHRSAGSEELRDEDLVEVIHFRSLNRESLAPSK